MKVGDLVRVPPYSYVEGFVGIVTKKIDGWARPDGVLVESFCGKHSQWVYEWMKPEVLNESR